jgi:hypothetical protein
MSPQTLQEKFFSDSEIAGMLGMLAAHEALIDKYGETQDTMPPSHRHMEPIPGLWLGFFGTAWYWSKDKETYKARCDKTRDLLLDVVPYRRICEAISEISGLPCGLANTLNPPGFHIFNNSTEKTHRLEILNWHQDQFLPGVFMRSWLIPVRLPADPCGVDYEDNGEIHRFDYSANTLYGWDGRMPHTISAMVLQPGEQRVTLQCHTVENESGLLLFW